jgi:hypothetical protein
VKQPDGRYRVLANVTWHVVAISENADVAETRRKLAHARSQLATEKNIPVLAKLVMLRAEIAQRWATPAGPTTRPSPHGRLGRDRAAVRGRTRGRPEAKFEAEWRRCGAQGGDTGKPDAETRPWDIAYYTNKLMKERYAVDTDALRVFFPYQATLEGMFRTSTKDLRPEIHPRSSRRTPGPRACSSMSCRRRHRRADGRLLPRHVPARGKVQPLRLLPANSASVLPMTAVRAAGRLAGLQFPPPPKPTSPRCSATTTSRPSSTSSAT